MGSLEVNYEVYDLINGGQNGGHLENSNICHVRFLFVGNWGQGNQICREYSSVRPLKDNFGVHDLLMKIKMEITVKL